MTSSLNCTHSLKSSSCKFEFKHNNNSSSPLSEISWHSDRINDRIFGNCKPICFKLVSVTCVLDRSTCLTENLELGPSFSTVKKFEINKIIVGFYRLFDTNICYLHLSRICLSSAFSLKSRVWPSSSTQLVVLILDRGPNRPKESCFGSDSGLVVSYRSSTFLARVQFDSACFSIIVRISWWCTVFNSSIRAISSSKKVHSWKKFLFTLTKWTLEQLESLLF